MKASFTPQIGMLVEITIRATQNPCQETDMNGKLITEQNKPKMFIITDIVEVKWIKETELMVHMIEQETLQIRKEPLQLMNTWFFNGVLKVEHDPTEQNSLIEQKNVDIPELKEHTEQNQSTIPYRTLDTEQNRKEMTERLTRMLSEHQWNDNRMEDIIEAVNLQNQNLQKNDHRMSSSVFKKHRC